MMPAPYAEIYPVVTIKESRSVRRFVCTRVLITRRDDRVVLRFSILSEEGTEFWGRKPYRGDLPTISTFQETGSSELAKMYGFELGVVEEFKRVLEFFDEPVGLKDLLPEKKVV